MKIDNTTLDKLAKLAKINIKEEEREKLIADMSSILDWVEKLNEVNTDGVEPITQMTHEINRFRSDEVSHNLTSEEALKNASKKVDDFFVVPKVIKK
jgi:aspartyl-tRNA(Asn)/glutamyl-tRNA(Gln) amidotransferase subunit C